MPSAHGFVSLIGAGPWDPELLTLAARDRLARADVVIVDYLVNPASLLHCRSDAQIVQRAQGPHGQRSSQLEQQQVNELLLEHAKAGRFVVRLKGGDPMLFGRGAEEAGFLREHGVPFEFVPGVSSAIAAPEAAGIPITHRDHTPSVSFVSGYEAYDKAGLAVAWEHLARSAGTLVLMMSVRNARTNAEKLIAAGRSPSTPAAIVRWGTRGIQQTLTGTLADIADRIDTAGLRPPAIMIVGEVVRLREQLAWFEARPLFGKRIVVTRALEQAGGLLRSLSALGADVVPIPCLGFAPPAPEQLAALDHALARVREYEGLIVSSQTGVDALVGSLRRSSLDMRALAGVTVVAIGQTTSEAAIAHGLRPDLIPDQAHSEGLVELLRARDLLGKRWLQIRADEGRDLLAAAIASAGGTLDLRVGYTTIRPSVSPLLLDSLRPPDQGGEGYDAIAFASGRTAKHFVTSLAEQLGDEAQALASIARAKVVAIGPVTAGALASMQIRVDAIAEQPSEAALVDALLDLLGT